MAKEVALLEPLSGSEIKDIILQEIGKALEKDCTLVDDISYAGFGLKFSVNLTYLRATTKETLVWGVAKVGEDVADGVVEFGIVDGEYATDSPNGARQDHDLGVPVLIDTPAGKKRRRVKFQRAV